MASLASPLVQLPSTLTNIAKDGAGHAGID